MNPWTLLSGGFQDLRHPPVGNHSCLDVLRTVAVSLVFLFHLRGYTPHAYRTLGVPFIRFGWTGVDLFFVLSGLLIGGQLWKELQGTGTVDLPRFILRRGFRIWPIYYCLVAFLLAQQLLFAVPRPGLWLDATFTSNYYHFLHTTHQVGGGWSLSLEEQFYLFIPVLLMLGAKLIPPRKLVAFIFLWFLALPLVRHFVLRGLSDPRDIHTAIYYPFQTHSDGLALGLLLSWVLVWKPNFLRAGRWLDLVLVVATLAAFYSWKFASPTFLFSAVAIAYSALVFLLLRLPAIPLFRCRFFYVASRLSYGVYLIHPGLLKHVMPFHTRFLGEGFLAFLSASVIWGAASLILAFLTFSFIELPFLRIRTSLVATPKKPEVARPMTTSTQPLTVTSPTVT